MAIERVVTSGTFSIDGEDFAVDNNVWLVGDEVEVVVLDAAHDHEPILAAIRGREVVAIVATHGHNDHINAGAALADATGAPILLHPADAELWAQVYPDRRWDRDLRDGDVLDVGGHELLVLHTPGHTPGGLSLYDEAAGVVFSADTLFKGGPGATGRSFSDFPTIIESIRTKLLTLPPDTIVHTGHGDDTRIGDEAPHLEEWIARGS
ncbi:MAG TPA: MBL fold metallo-hydrolase [Acidimicrobiales bacterium]|nr:MBL fold metallo-hydrolase [Acidimicrobiales bacterium]